MSDLHLVIRATGDLVPSNPGRCTRNAWLRACLVLRLILLIAAPVPGADRVNLVNARLPHGRKPLVFGWSQLGVLAQCCHAPILPIFKNSICMSRLELCNVG